MLTTTPAATSDDARLVTLDPAATAMVWLGAGHPHEATAIPGVHLGPRDVLVAVELATICGSDLHTVRGDRPGPAPMVLGHEQVGRVVALGANPPTAADGIPLDIGDRIVWSVTISCGMCDRCRSGLPQACRTLHKYGHERIQPRWELTGGFATHTHLRAGTAIVRVPERVPAELLAPVSCGTATAWAAMETAAAVVDPAGATVLVMGAGLIGLTVTAMASDRGATVLVSDPDPVRRELAMRFGATATVDPRSGVNGSHGLRAALTLSGGAPDPDIVIEASGASRAVGAGFAAIGQGGVLVLVGSVSPSDPVSIDPERLVRQRVTVRGVHNYTGADLAAAVTWIGMRGTAYPFAELVSPPQPLSEIDGVFERAGRGGPVRYAIDPRR